MKIIVEESTIMTTVHYSENKEHRYLLSKSWNEEQPKIAVIMLVAGNADIIIQDVTTACIINCVSKLGYGGVDVLNLYSKVNAIISVDMEDEEYTDENNDKMLVEIAEKVEAIVFAWGKGDETNLKIKRRVKEVVELLEKFKSKCYWIGDKAGRIGFSPMYAKVRSSWELIKLCNEETAEEKLVEKKEAKIETKPRRKKSS